MSRTLELEMKKPLTLFISKGIGMKSFFAAWGAMLGVMLEPVPDAVEKGTVVLAVLIAMDYLLGIQAARAEGRMQSAASRKKGTVKLGTYAALLMGFGLIAWVMEWWWLYGGALAFAAATEIMSHQEKLKRIREAGVPLGAFGPLDALYSVLGFLIGKLFPAPPAVPPAEKEKENS